MNPFWIIEDFERDNSFQDLADAVKRSGCEVHVMKYVPFDEGILNKFPEERKCVAFQGSIQFTEKIQKYRPAWVPGVWASWDNFECTEYYSHWGEYLFNKEYMMMPLSEVSRRRSDLLEFYGGKFFMRPSTNSKTFTGTVIESYPHPHDSTGFTWDEWGFIMNEAKGNELVLVARPQAIHKEWRVVCTKEEAITASRYKTHGQGDYKKEFPDDVWEFAQNILEETTWRPDPLFMMDVCEDANGDLHLLEIGAFSCAGLYHCDVDVIVKHANRIAVEQFEEQT